MFQVYNSLTYIWTIFSETFTTTTLQVLVLFLLWILFNLVKILRAQKWMIDGGYVSVMDVTRKIEEKDGKIYEYFTVYGYLSPRITKIKQWISKKLKRRVFLDVLSANELFGVAKYQEEDDFITIRRPDGKKLEYHQIISCNLGKTQYLLWKPYEITFLKIGDESNMKIVLEISDIKVVKNDWNL